MSKLSILVALANKGNCRVYSELLGSILTSMNDFNISRVNVSRYHYQPLAVNTRKFNKMQVARAITKNKVMNNYKFTSSFKGKTRFEVQSILMNCGLENAVDGFRYYIVNPELYVKCSDNVDLVTEIYHSLDPLEVPEYVK